MSISGELYGLSLENVNIAPAQHGVYALYQDGVTSYIGRAAGEGVTIRSRLQSHFHGHEGACTASATAYRREVMSSPVLREQELLDQYEEEYGELPRCNERRA